ncbi:hypothetical protein EYF80_041256 [Liparis tanakae]|uniref:Uncharacterized protein n=1 Tax=Liparis tanakae TaxID=230148 RepID=A0A4Z2G5Z0_9TELE|nr:hypothetical protein EYF80_041256 [Liparis tanakae]
MGMWEGGGATNQVIVGLPRRCNPIPSAETHKAQRGCRVPPVTPTEPDTDTNPLRPSKHGSSALTPVNETLTPPPPLPSSISLGQSVTSGR